MKNKILGFFILLSLLFSLTGCGMLNKLFHKNNEENTEITSGSAPIMYQETHEYNSSQVDSMCVADTLPRTFDSWTPWAYLDHETNNYIVRYMYIKEYNDNYEIIYIITPRGDIYIVSKRKVSSN